MARNRNKKTTSHATTYQTAKTPFHAVLDDPTKIAKFRSYSLDPKIGEAVLDQYPDVFVPSTIISKLQAYIDGCKLEISGLGYVSVLSNGDLHVTDVHLLEQECTGGTTELDMAAVGNYMMEHADRMQDIHLWWHSHVNMTVFWSQTDHDNISDLKGMGWLLSIVGNKKGEWKARLDVYTPFRITLDDLPIQIYEPVAGELHADCRAEIEAKVRLRTYGAQGSHLGYQGRPTGAHTTTPHTQPSTVKPTSQGSGGINPLFQKNWRKNNTEADSSGLSETSSNQAKGLGRAPTPLINSTELLAVDERFHTEEEALYKQLLDLSNPEQDAEDIEELRRAIVDDTEQQLAIKQALAKEAEELAINKVEPTQNNELMPLEV